MGPVIPNVNVKCEECEKIVDICERGLIPNGLQVCFLCGKPHMAARAQELGVKAIAFLGRKVLAKR